MQRNTPFLIRRSGQRDLPAFAEDRFDQLVGLLAVREAQIGGVPFQLAGNADGDRSQDEPFGVRPGDAEIGASRRAAFAGANPIAAVRGVVAAGARAGRTRKKRLAAACIRPTARRATGRRLRRARWFPSSPWSRRRCSCSRCGRRRAVAAAASTAAALALAASAAASALPRRPARRCLAVRRRPPPAGPTCGPLPSILRRLPPSFRAADKRRPTACDTSRRSPAACCRARRTDT